MKKRSQLSLSVCLLSLITGVSYSQNVSFDSTFGINARTFTQNGNPIVFSSDYKYTKYFPDQSFFMTGAYGQPDSNFFITKFKPGGEIDSSYANNGKLFIRRANLGVSSILGSGFDSSSRFILIGKIPSPTVSNYFRLRIIRFTSDAKIDSSFGVNGMADIPFDNPAPSANHLVIPYKDGRLLINCIVYENLERHGALLRLMENGNLDNSFNGNGKTLLPRTQGTEDIFTINIQTDEKILVGWSLGLASRLYRFNTTGIPDAGFNQSGYINIDFPFPNNGIRAVRILNNNKIVISAGSINGNYLYMLKANGQRDTSFGNNGYVLYNYGYKTYARDIAEQPDGKIITAGVIQDNQLPIPNINSMLTRTNPDGSIDSTFDNDGVWFFNYGNDPSSGMKHISLLSTGKLLFSGLESGPGWVQFVTYRLKEVYNPAIINWGNSNSLIINNNCSSEVRLNWTTLNESNTNYFVIQHSYDNNNFTMIAQIPASGNSNIEKSYQYTHRSPRPGINYYKIRVVTLGGQEVVYGTISTVLVTTSNPLFAWRLHTTVKRQGDECLPAIKLHFTTLQPLISDSIAIEHSRDSVNFTEIGKIAVSNPQTQVTEYSYTDQNVLAGANYYRLKINDPNTSCYSSVYKADIENTKNIRVFPVPTFDKLFFNQVLPEGSVVVIFDMKGSMVIKKKFTSASSELSLAHLASGQYIIKIDAFCHETVLKIMKMR